ncbi:MAG: hypothetical protein QOJ54_1118, partial [Aliidongia sp.]|nr:hypothetical protein [Aliidongia sp.]
RAGCFMRSGIRTFFASIADHCTFWVLCFKSDTRTKYLIFKFKFELLDEQCHHQSHFKIGEMDTRTAVIISTVMNQGISITGAFFAIWPEAQRVITHGIAK